MKGLSAGKIVLLGLLGLVIVLLIWGMSAYNRLVALDENVKTAQADIEVQYQRRFDLIPNLVNSVEGIFNQERAVFTALADARARYAGAPAGTPDRVEAIQQVESALGRLLVVVENYPQLRSSESVQRLMDELAGTENRVSVSRNNYNGVVNELNQTVRRFPTNIIAGVFNFEQRERFEVLNSDAVNAPQVEFSQ